MIELKGKYGSAYVYTDVVDEASISQVTNLLNQPYAENARVRMMPDIHAGAGCTIGTTMQVSDKICPNLVGVDIGCGMETVKLREKRIELQKLDKLIRQNIPSGFAIQTKAHRFAKNIDLDELHCAKHVKLDRAVLSIGTLGGGNHFIEVDKDEEGNLYLVIHSGSRHLGVEICDFYMKAARKGLEERGISIPYTLSYVEGHLMDAYLHDMRIAQTFADLNRKAMVDVILIGLRLRPVEQFTTIHNYIDTEHHLVQEVAVDVVDKVRVVQITHI